MKNRAKPSISELADLLKMSKNGGIFPPKKMWDFGKNGGFCKNVGIRKNVGFLKCVPNVFQMCSKIGIGQDLIFSKFPKMRLK